LFKVGLLFLGSKTMAEITEVSSGLVHHSKIHNRPVYEFKVRFSFFFNDQKYTGVSFRKTYKFSDVERYTSKYLVGKVFPIRVNVIAPERTELCINREWFFAHGMLFSFGVVMMVLLSPYIL
jgi:hypothetical protein